MRWTRTRRAPRPTWTSCWRSASPQRRPPSAAATAVIAAAGSGERLGAGGPKALVELAGRPMLEHSLEAFERAQSVGAIVVAVPPGEERRVDPARAEAVAGGASRSESVREALRRVQTELVAVHDAARPLVTAELIDELMALLASRPDAAGVIAAAPITDTVKRAREPRTRAGVPRGGPTVSKTLSREHLWAAQTPQVFRADRLREAMQADPQRLATASDDAMLVEKAGGKVLMHPSPQYNMKVTTRRDLAVAELLLAGL